MPKKAGKRGKKLGAKRRAVKDLSASKAQSVKGGQQVTLHAIKF
jgi:hypothetical protein